MTYQVLYRVWRPQSFEEMAGQEHIRRTLESEAQEEIDTGLSGLYELLPVP